MMAWVMETSPSRDHALSVTANSPSANLSSANLSSSVRFSGEEGGHSLAEMARRDLDAALQLLADRAQYITGASGAAIALRRNGKKDMLCRASTGSNAPELGALLSTEFGLSGESVRTRQPLRCDDAERDARVNHEVCRQLGIASVVVMPVVNDDEVLGVFELFSGRVNAFGERDLSAVQRLSEMVETAVRLAEATENLPERLRTSEISAPEVGDAGVEEDKVLGGQVLEELVLEGPIPGELVAEELVLEEVVLKEPELVLEVAAEASAEKARSGGSGIEGLAENIAGATPEPLQEKVPTPSRSLEQALAQKAREDGAPIVQGTAAAAAEPPKDKGTVAHSAVTTAPVASPPAEPAPVASVETAPPQKPLFWSAAPTPAGDDERPEEADQSHIPPVLRSLRKCEACGFPVSAGRVLCVECEEKKWRGQLRVPQADGPRQVAAPARVAPVAVAPTAEARAFAVAAQSVAAGIPAPSTQRISAAVKESKVGTGQLLAGRSAAHPPAPQTASVPAPEPLGVSSASFVLSAGLEPSQSWLSANKYVIGVLLVVAIIGAVVFLMR
jgi:GAF domain-containing protein